MDHVHLRRLETAAPWPSALHFLEQQMLGAAQDGSNVLVETCQTAVRLQWHLDKRSSLFYATCDNLGIRPAFVNHGYQWVSATRL